MSAIVLSNGAELVRPETFDECVRVYDSLRFFPDTDQDRYLSEYGLGRTDLFFLLGWLLGRRDVVNEWTFKRCREVQANPDGFLDLWAREHYKSTIITFGLTIFDILSNPEITVGIFSHTRPIAKSFLRQIKREFEQNERLKELYADVLWEKPEKDAPMWSEEGLVVRRHGNPKEATVEAWGLVDGQPTGRHFQLRVYDDVVTRESVTTPEQVAKTTQAWELSDNLGVSSDRGGIVRHIGTRYSLRDTYAEIIKRKAAIPRYHPATHNGRIDGNPVLFTPREWERRLRTQSRATLAAQLLQNPMADESAIFKSLWLRRYEVRPKTLNVYILCDPSRGRNAESDNTAMVVVGIARSGAKFLLDGFCHRMALSERWVKLRDLYRKWSRQPGVRMVRVGYERYGAQSDDEYFKEQMNRDKVWFEIKEVSWVRDGGQAKRDRVERLEPDFRNSRFYLPMFVWHEARSKVWDVVDDPDNKLFGEVTYNSPEGLTQAQMQVVEGGSPELIAKAIKCVDQDRHLYDLTVHFIGEYVDFPFGQYKDLLDATSRIYDMEPVPPVVYAQSDVEPAQSWDR